MFSEPQTTQFDLNWRIFGVHVRVHPLFWLIGALLGWDLVQRDFRLLLLWIACVFVSILLHEFGHVWMGQVFGSRGHIVLYGMGGLAIGSSDLRNRWQRVAVFLAGPGIGFVLAGLLWPLWYYEPVELTRWARVAVIFLFDINLFWGLVNLLPVFPLDGGRVSWEVWQWLVPDRGTRIALGISMTVAGLLAVNALSIQLRGHALPGLDRIPILGDLGGYWMALLFGWMAYASYQMLQMEAYRGHWEKDEEY